MTDARGFTLIELIVTMAILGILLGMAAISGRDWIERYRVQGQTKQLYSDLMNARVGAMQRNRIFFVTLAANQYGIYEDTYSAAAGTPTPDGDGILQQGAGQDRPVMQKAAQYALASSPTITGFNFTANGLVSFYGTSPPTVVAIQCQSTANNPASDCIEVRLTRILMGKWNGSTSTCITQ